ncbi:MAG: DUF3090 domain-containing protein [Anaerolineae bacterium]|nr:DUF3090 domain-containing protein [Anaerolineae bacterium]
MAPEDNLDFDPISHITVDAIGKPGQRVFYIQAICKEQAISLLVEKIQIQTLAVGVEQFLGEITERFPALAAASVEYDEEKMKIYPPVDPLFRVGELGLSYDVERDLLILVAREAGPSENPEENRIARFWCTRSQLRAMCHWGVEITKRGRPICPQCGEPMEPEGHFCPKKNGHKH